MPRTIDISTPLDQDVLLFHKMKAKEELGRLSECDLRLLSEDQAINLDDVLGKTVTVAIRRPDDTLRYYNGYVTRIAQVGRHGKYHAYQATVRPWLWFLTRTTNCRIFQKKTVPDIIKDIFGHHSGIVDVQYELTESYGEWEYCVQYRESDFDFVSRLMEHEGIYYFFRHVEGRHTLVLADSYSAHSAAVEEEIPFIPPGRAVRADKEHVNEWTISRELQPGKYALTDYDFERPSVDLQVKSHIKREHALAEYEVYDYPGDYLMRNDGETYARTRIEELQAKHDRVEGVTNSRNIATGYLFKLGAHPRDDQNAEYLVASTELELQSSEYEAIDPTAAPAAVYKATFTALPSKQPFRSERLTKKPMVRGPQTAIVVGPAGETIFTDNYGRIKVHFHWDRHDNRDENSSTWIRVSQNWGGKNWGGMFIPHVGQEVIVMFEEGDPDRPLVSGRVYNSEQMPPLALPANKTKSAIRDHGGNEIIMEGKDGVQQIRLFSPTANTKISMGAPNDPHELKCTTDGNSGWICQGHLDTNVGKNFTIVVKGNEDKTILGKLKDTITGPFHRNIFLWVSVLIGGFKTEVIVGAETKLIKGAKTEFTNGVSIKSHKGPAYENKPDEAHKTSGKMLRQVGGAAKQLFGQWRAESKGKAEIKAANKLLEEAKSFHMKAAAEMHQETKKLMVAVSDAYTCEAVSHLIKASNIRTKGAHDFNNGALKIK